MIELAYTSSASWLFSGADIEAILRVSRAHNAATGITGILLYKSGSIFQILEGEPAAVHALYARIIADRRHTNVTLLYDRPLKERSFPRWTMGFQELDDFKAEGDDVHRWLGNELHPEIRAQGSSRRLVDRFVASVR